MFTHENNHRKYQTCAKIPEQTENSRAPGEFTFLAVQAKILRI